MSEEKVFGIDNLNSIGVLKRREIEARILIPFVKALNEVFEPDKVKAVLQNTIIAIAQDQGAGLAAQCGENNLQTFAETLTAWTKDDALEIDVQRQTNEYFEFNVIRCRYAEMYLALGIPELGSLLSCNRDFSLIEGFNPDVNLTRTQTIMEGAAFCDFRYRLGGQTKDHE